MFEYDHSFATPEDLADPKLAADLATVNRYAAMPTNEAAVRGYFETELARAGFVDIQVHGDYSDKIRPMLRLFWLLAVVPMFFVRLVRAEKFFINTLAGAKGYAGPEALALRCHYREETQSRGRRCGDRQWRGRRRQGQSAGRAMMTGVNL